MAVPDERGRAQPRACADNADGPVGTGAGSAEHAMGARTGFGQARAGFRREIVDYPARADAVPLPGVGQIHFQRRVGQPGFQRIGDGASHADDERVGGAGMPIQGRSAGADECARVREFRRFALAHAVQGEDSLVQREPGKTAIGAAEIDGHNVRHGASFWDCRGNPEA